MFMKCLFEKVWPIKYAGVRFWWKNFSSRTGAFTEDLVQFNVGQDDIRIQGKIYFLFIKYNKKIIIMVQKSKI